jgi:hypothetical protein
MTTATGVYPYASEQVEKAITDRVRKYNDAFEEFRNQNQLAEEPIQVSTNEEKLLEAIIEIFVPMLTKYSSNIAPDRWREEENVIRNKLLHEMKRFVKKTDDNTVKKRKE